MGVTSRNLRGLGTAAFMLLAATLLHPEAFNPPYSAEYRGVVAAADAPAGSPLRSLLQSLPPCTTVQSCGSDCRNCSVTIKVPNGKPTCVKRGITYACSVQCNTGFKLKAFAGQLICSRPAGLKPPDNFVNPSRNATKRTYRAFKTVGDRLRNMGASSPAIVAQVACGESMDTPECFEKLLMGVLPAAYSSNNSRDTGGYAFISPAQDQLGCSACVGFAATAAVEAAVNVYKQQSWSKLNLSEADFNFCKFRPPTDCNSGAPYQALVDAVTAGKLTHLAPRECYAYHGTNLDTCMAADACTSKMPVGSTISMAHNGNAFGSLAMLKQKIMLHGGVMTAMAKLPAFEGYPGTPPRTIFDEEVPADKYVDLHAVFCYGFADSAATPGAGHWLCKNSWGTSWGLRGTFRIAYGAAVIMPADYTYAVQFGLTGSDKLYAVKQQLRQGSTHPTQSGNATAADDCCWYQVNNPMRLVQLHDLLTTLASSQAGYGPTTKARVLSNLISSNLGHVADLAAANNTLRVCGTTRQLLLNGILSYEQDELESLLNIKAAIDKRDVLLLWSSETGANGGYCRWYQIICSNGRVEQIILNASSRVTGLQGSLPSAAALRGLSKLRLFEINNQPGIKGTLPADWAQLQQLETIILASNSLTGSIPAWWGSLSNLTWLALWNNQLTGPIPESLGDLVKLEGLVLLLNDFTGRIPTSLGNLQQLTYLNLRGKMFQGYLGTGLRGPIPDSLGGLKRLTFLDMSNNALTGTIPSSLGNLTSLTQLDLNLNYLTGSIPSTLGGLKNLTSLELRINALSGGIPDALGTLTVLERLDLTLNSLTGPVPTWLDKLVSLKELRLSQNMLTGTLPYSLGSLVQLVELDLGYNKLHGPLADNYKALTMLKLLNLSNNTLTGSVPPSWSSMTWLQDAWLADNPGLSGCLPSSWQPQLLEEHTPNIIVVMVSNTNITGFCTS